jgi:hypothetical protein
MLTSVSPDIHDQLVFKRNNNNSNKLVTTSSYVQTLFHIVQNIP